MGIVYEAETLGTKRRVAIKIMHPENQLNQENVKRFLNEGANAGRVKHPNVVEFIEMGQDPADGSLFIVLELLRGTDLSTYLVRYGRMEPRDALVVAAQVLQALAVAHDAEIVHRDIKPENIFLTKGSHGDAHVKIVDFGISKAINPEKNFMGSITQINTTVGTPHYMSPEQAKGEPIDPRADLWALGVVLYESLTGHLPFDGDNFNTQIVAVVTEPHVPAATYGVDRGLSDVIDRCLQKDRHHRFEGARAMLDALREYVAKHPEVGLAESDLFAEQNTQEWRVPKSAQPKGAPDGASAAPEGEGEAIETAPVFPGMVSIEDDVGADAPTKVRPLDRSAIRPATGAPRPATPVAATPAPLAAAPPPRPAPRPAVLVALALVTALVTGTTTYTVYQRFKPQPVATNFVRLRFLNLPPGAQVLINGVPVDHPESLQIPRSTREMQVRVAVEGFEPQDVRVTPNNHINVELRPFAPLVPPSPQPLAPAPLVAPDAATSPGTPPVAAPDAVAAPDVASAAAHAPAQAARAPAPRNAAPAAPTEGTFLQVGGSGCTVRIDGQAVGAAPVMRHPVAAGRHVVECVREGRPMSQPVTVPAGQTVQVRF